jgi:NAD binding domain of 6-phosphogluconate dehydrogenase
LRRSILRRQRKPWHTARRAEIKKAAGTRQAKILEAEGEAQAIKLVNEAADKYFVGNAQLLKRNGRYPAAQHELSSQAASSIARSWETCKCFFGMIGLGRVGATMVRRLIKGGRQCVVYDSEADAVVRLVDKVPSGQACSKTLFPDFPNRVRSGS